MRQKIRISLENPLVYFHIPKCAGTSITDVFKKEFGDDMVRSPATFIDYHVTPVNYAKYKVYAGHIFYDQVPLLPKNASFITVLRNPGKRLLSLYGYYRAHSSPAHNFSTINLAKILDFHDWLECNDPGVASETRNAIVRYFTPKAFFASEAPACRQNILYASEDFVSKFSVVGFSEYADITHKILCQTFDLTASNNGLGHLNKKAVVEFLYSESRLREFVQKHCMLDLEFLAYCVSIFRRQCPLEFLKDINGVEKTIYLEYFT